MSKEIPGAKPVPLGQLVRAQDRLSFVYLEHCVVHRDANALTARDAKGTIHVPAATLGAVLLGPGTTVSQQAMVLLAESGSTAVWVGEHGVRYYAHGRSLARSARLLEAQAALVSNQRSRLRVARQMYAMRFPGEDTTGLTMQQLRGREGARVRKVYREHSRRTGVEWGKREYDPDNFDDGNPVNRALSAANASLYGVVHAVIVALGCAPGLGFVHTGHILSFVFDIADLYKAEISIPIAFDVAASEPADVGGTTRRAVRDHMKGTDFLETCVRDVKTLLTIDEDATDHGPESAEEPDHVALWDGGDATVAAGVAYGDALDDMPPDIEEPDWPEEPT